MATSRSPGGMNLEALNHLLDRASDILDAGTLSPGRLARLDGLVDISRERNLSSKEVSDLQFLVMVGEEEQETED